METIQSGHPLPDELIRRLTTASRIAVLTGAGVSAESGVPTFRDAQTGLWANHDPMALATPEGFERDPGLVWDWYTWRRELIARAKPNTGHTALAQLEQSCPGLSLITQNVDGLHRQAGSERVLELHGNIQRTICSVTRQPITAGWLADHAGQRPPPSPHSRDGFARPDVVWFGEMLDSATLEAAFEAAGQCQFMIIAGTAGAVQPAASIPALAHRNAATLVDINPEAGELSALCDWHLAGNSTHWLPKLAVCRQADRGHPV